MENWLNQQIHCLAKQWSGSIEKFYPQYLPMWKNPEEHVRALQNDWNLLDAVKYFDWINVIGTESVVLDLGCGTGWLSSYLSNFQGVVKIDALDSDGYNLNNMLPEVVRLLKGNAEKITPILGLFGPIQRPDRFYDLIVASSAVHHADNIYPLLREIKRVLKPGGAFVILNETPLSDYHMFLKYLRIFINISINLCRKKAYEFSPTISTNKFLYDPYLGDHAYTFFQWSNAIKSAGFNMRIITTPFKTYKKGYKKSSSNLFHFHCN